MACLNLKFSPKCSKLQGLGPFFQLGIPKTGDDYLEKTYLDPSPAKSDLESISMARPIHVARIHIVESRIEQFGEHPLSGGNSPF